MKRRSPRNRPKRTRKAPVQVPVRKARGGTILGDALARAQMLEMCHDAKYGPAAEAAKAKMMAQAASEQEVVEAIKDAAEATGHGVVEGADAVLAKIREVK